MSRLVPYRTKVPELIKTRIEQTLATTMYLVQTTGPTSYVVRRCASCNACSCRNLRASHVLNQTRMYCSIWQIQEQHCEKKHKVLIGALQNCSCGDRDLCVHILFVMLKVRSQQ